MLAPQHPPAKAEPLGVPGRVALAVLATGVLVGAWVRFNDRVASAVPVLAMPDGVATDRMVAEGAPRGLVELALLQAGATAEAVASMGLPAGDAAALSQAIRRGRAHLVRMPLFDAGDALSDAALADTARVVQVSSGGYTRVVHLTRQPVVVTLPIGPVGSVMFSVAGAGSVAIGALTLNGPVRFPDLPAGQSLNVGVVAQ